MLPAPLEREGALGPAPALRGVGENGGGGKAEDEGCSCTRTRLHSCNHRDQEFNLKKSLIVTLSPCKASLTYGPVDWKGSNIEVVTEAKPWPKDQVRRASANSFGYGGANSHAILEAISAELVDYTYRVRAAKASLGILSCCLQKPPIKPKLNQPQLNGFIKDVHAFGHKNVEDRIRQYHLLCFSGHDEQTIMNNMSAISQVAGRHEFGQLAYNLAVRRTHLSYRAFTVARVGEPTIPISDAVLSKKKCHPTSPSLGFVFTGQGAQWSQMGKNLLYEFPCFKVAISELDHVLSKLPERPSWTLEGM